MVVRTPSPPVTPPIRQRIQDSRYAKGSVFVGFLPTPTVTPNTSLGLGSAALKDAEASAESDVAEAHALVTYPKLRFDQPSIPSTSQDEVESRDQVYQDIKFPVTPKRSDQLYALKLHRTSRSREERHTQSQGLLQSEQSTSKNIDVA
jgi:hypothetical protein